MVGGQGLPRRLRALMMPSVIAVPLHTVASRACRLNLQHRHSAKTGLQAPASAAACTRWGAISPRGSTCRRAWAWLFPGSPRPPSPAGSGCLQKRGLAGCREVLIGRRAAAIKERNRQGLAAAAVHAACGLPLAPRTHWRYMHGGRAFTRGARVAAPGQNVRKPPSTAGPRQPTRVGRD